MKNEPIMTGFTCLDNILGGYRPGTINVIAGRGLAGKTAIAMNIAQNVARTSGKAVAYYSGKERKAKIVERLIKSNVRRLSRSNSYGASNVSVDLDWNDKRILFSETVTNSVIRFDETVEKIIDETAGYFGCTQNRIRTGPNSFKKNYERMVAIAVCEDLLDVSNNKLEKHFGLVASREKIVQITSVDPDFEKDVEAVKKAMRQL